MNCTEFESALPEYLEQGVHTPEQQAHLNSCPVCSGLISDLEWISSQAKSLLAADEPRPAVWNALETRLRSEGLIHDTAPTRFEFIAAKESFFRRWRTAWLVPVAAALAIVAGLKLYHPVGVGDKVPIAKQVQVAPAAVAAKAPVSHEDQQWLNSVASRPPAQLARYRADLDDANAFIHDAEQTLQRDPNDVYMQQMLINAYEQKQMLYELAVDQSSQ